MKKLEAIIAAGWVASAVANAAETNTFTLPKTSTDWAGFTNGVPLAEFQKQLGVVGIREPNATRSEAIYDFDFEGLWVKAVVAIEADPPLVKRFVLIEDGLSPVERRNERIKRGPEWAAAMRASTTPVTNSTSPRETRPAATNGTPQQNTK